MNRENIDKGWKFFRDASSIEELATADSISVNLPHTWNNLDGQDGGGDYYRGKCFYQKLIDLNKKEDKDYYIEFRGVNSIAYVYVNNVLVCEHRGGYSTFRCDITKYTNRGVNTIVVAVDNSANDSVYPQMADFTFFGGIYRDVYVLEVPRSRFDLDYYGSEGVMITPTITDNVASVVVESFLTGALESQSLNVTISYKGDIVESKVVNPLSPKVEFKIENPILWDGVDAPNLYTANVRLIDNDETIDSRTINFGIRSFAVDKDGFYLNGRKYALHGVSRHQDRQDMGYAITKKEHEEDMDLIREVGATTIRLAHYQHDQYFYDLCDEAGMVVWAEIPYISMHLKDGDKNAIEQMKELVIQNYNHASIMFWGLSNEITMGGESEEQLALHKVLNDMVHDMDKTRLTTMANVTMCDTHSPLLSVPDIFSYNHYFGWYVGNVNDNATWIDDFRREFPDTPLGISEYGCEAILSWHSSTPKQGDYTEEYQAYYHENMLRIFEERPYLWATHVWNMFDFGVDSRDEGGVKGRNNKGLVTYDRKTKKDSFYLYKAYWSKEPFVHICSQRYVKRAEKETTIKVYSNQDKVDLYVGGKLLSSKKGDKIFTFNVPLSLLGTKVRAVAGGFEDNAKFRRVLTPCKSYILKGSKDKVNNWFEVDGVRYEFKYPEGKFSIKDKLNEILASKEGAVVIKGMIGKALEMMGKDADPDKFLKGGIIKLVGGMPIERIASMAGDKISQEMLYQVNEELNKISK